MFNNDPSELRKISTRTPKFSYNQPRVISGAGCVIKNEKGEFLLVLGKKKKLWSFPKGHIENTESHVECAERETFEETGLKIKITSEPKFYVHECVYYTCDLQKKDHVINVRDNKEIKKCQWMSLDQISKMSYYKTNVHIKSYFNVIHDVLFHKQKQKIEIEVN